MKIRLIFALLLLVAFSFYGILFKVANPHNEQNASTALVSVDRDLAITKACSDDDLAWEPNSAEEERLQTPPVTRVPLHELPNRPLVQLVMPKTVFMPGNAIKIYIRTTNTQENCLVAPPASFLPSVTKCGMLVFDLTFTGLQLNEASDPANPALLMMNGSFPTPPREIKYGQSWTELCSLNQVMESIPPGSYIIPYRYKPLLTISDADGLKSREIQFETKGVLRFRVEYPVAFRWNRPKQKLLDFHASAVTSLLESRE